MKGASMQDLLARIRILDPDLRFDDGDAPADAMAAFEFVFRPGLLSWACK